MKIKKIYILPIFTAILAIVSCVKENPEDTSASFSTNISGSLSKGQAFTVYLDDASGEFLTYFKGDKDANTYGVGLSGTPINVDEDSVSVSGGYAAAGSYTFTIVARSFGNWGEDMEEDVQSITINVVE